MAAVGAPGRWAQEPSGDPGGERVGLTPRVMEPSPPRLQGLAPQVAVGGAQWSLPSPPPNMCTTVYGMEGNVLNISRE